MTAKYALIPLFIGVCTLATAQGGGQSGQGQASQGQSSQGQASQGQSGQGQSGQGQGGSSQGQASQGGSSQGGSSQGRMSSDGRMSGGKMSGGGEVARADQMFVHKAAVGGMAEVELGQMATEKASNAKVKEFGQRMVTDHGKANDELKALAAKKGITLPSETDAKHKATAAKMSKQSGPAFDRAYMRDMVQDHEKDAAEFQKEANSGADPDVKAWAAKTLPTLQEHLQQAKDALSGAGSGGNSGGSGSSGGAGNSGNSGSSGNSGNSGGAGSSSTPGNK